MPVNNTIVEHILNLLAPHHCVGCDTEGSLLCSGCLEVVRDSPLPRCCFCSKPSGHDWLCSSCRSAHACDAAWIVGLYENNLQKLLYAYKFDRARAAYKPLVELLDHVLPYIPTTCIVVNVPTIAQHVRRRGYDHTELLAKALATKRGLTYANLLGRKEASRQLGATRVQRFAQAVEAFGVTGEVPKGAQILLVDDVVTTGATVQAAARLLKEAGAQDVFVLAVAHEEMS